MFTLRDYQQELMTKTLSAWSSGKRRVLLQLSTGGGKTIIFAAMATEFSCRGEGVLVVAHREELILQAAEKLAVTCGIQPGILKAGYKPTDSLIQVASIQTLARRKIYPKAELVIVDEAHHASALSYRKLLEAYPNALILGVTATPRREDGYGLRDIFDHLICSITTKELIALGYLTDYKLIAGFKYSKHKVPQKRDFTKKELEEVASDYKPSEVVKQWQKFCAGKKTIIFAVNVKHSQAITAMFCYHNIACEHLDGETPPLERKAILDRFRSGETPIISNCAILTEGFDCPDSEAAVIARPTASVTLWLQMIGRILRPSPGKEFATILDMTDNWYRLGRPCDNRFWSLDPISCDPDTFGCRCCPYCHHVFKPMPGLTQTFHYFHVAKAEFIDVHQTDCPNCGTSFRWVLEESKVVESGGVPIIITTADIQFKEVPPDVRPQLIRPILEVKKRKFRTEEKKFVFYNNAIKNWFLECQELTLSELNYAVQLLGCREWIFEHSLECLAARVRKATEWEEVTKIMSRRPESVKKVVWTQLPRPERDRINKLKAEYERELKEWLTEENLILMVEDLESCSNMEMLCDLWQICNKQAIRVAVERLSGEKRDRISQWMQQLDAASS
ncbi:MAG: DEAD/DEAH box helicase [Scytonema sp. PMC 1069.18]|nr:DEAD/DEAH box helicase [Scytonema sp. PMC 1069.18]MEC4882723.1 DEAD/DEAH box helicase [Scytonema sp. PMC 1070.18]